MGLKIRELLHKSSHPPLVMGILNVTPDSFSDGGDYLDFDSAVSRAMQMIKEGADIIDVGPESTRPGSEPVSADEQIKRAIPVIRAIRKKNKEISISIDTRLAGVAVAAIESGADMINDVSALRDDPELADVVTNSDVDVVLMHRRKNSANMQAGGGPEYNDVVGEICDFLRERVEFAVSKGIDRWRIIIDPGIGFGKRVDHNLLILKHLERFVSLGLPVLIGASRKQFIGALLGVDDPKSREIGSMVCAVHAARSGASILRVHDIRRTVESLRMISSIHQPGSARI